MKLSEKIYNKLSKLGLESNRKCNLTLETCRKFCKEIGLNLDEKETAKTPVRIMKMFNNEILQGEKYNNFPKITTMKNDFNKELIICKNIAVYSLCEHHLLPMTGRCIIGYYPDKHIMGLSKFNRIVDFFSKRTQLQERLTRQIFESLKIILETDDIFVGIFAKHLCVEMRGIKDISSKTITLEYNGSFKDPTKLVIMTELLK